MNRLAIAGALTATLLGCSQQAEDLSWLEAVEGKAAIAWVDAANAATDSRLQQDSRYQTFYDEALALVSSKDRLPKISLIGDHVYNLWQDQDHPRGLYRRSPTQAFAEGKPEWQTVLDLDQLSAAEGKKWVFKDLDCLAPEYQHCLMQLSDGGGDSVEIREFDASTLQFVADGFHLPAAKSRVSWIDQDHLFVGSATTADNQTESGYPREVRRWTRGTELAAASLLFSADPGSVSASAERYDDGQQSLDIVTDARTFWENQHYLLLQDQTLAPLQLPATAELHDFVKGRLLVSLKADWRFNGREFHEGALILIKPQALLTPDKAAAHDIVELVSPSREFVVEEVEATAAGILVVGLVDVQAEARLYQLRNGQWVARALDLPKTGNLHLEAVNSKTGELFARYEDFLTPPSLYYVGQDRQPLLAAAQPASFDASPFKAEQYFAESADGTRVPYFVVMAKDARLDGKNPTHMFSYGGFRVSLKPSYSGSYEDLNGSYGKLWLARGGVFVLANIRGGGEYGPAWHSAVLKQNRPKAYEDFEAIARDLFARKITSPAHLGIEGRSNGGLLVGAAMTRQPELYGAVICGVPLLDMQRYHTLLAGASWMAEYGDPDSDDWQFIKTYSPLHNLREGQHYPPVLFYTSTRDDRVHPGHARKMAKRLQDLGQTVEYYENREGGHGGASTREQLAKRLALSYTLLWQQLGRKPGQ